MEQGCCMLTPDCWNQECGLPTLSLASPVMAETKGRNVRNLPKMKTGKYKEHIFNYDEALDVT